MADIHFNNVKFSQNHEDRIENVKREYKIIMSKCCSNTAFQLIYYDLVLRGYDLMDFAMEEYWSNVTLKKIEEYIDDVSSIVNSPEFKDIQEILKICAKVVTNSMKNTK